VYGAVPARHAGETSQDLCTHIQNRRRLKKMSHH
jgi:hypothetical protein